jgi:nucleotide-binding universal stress UspA family protein
MNGLPTNLGPESKGSGSPPGPAIDLQRILVPIDFSPASQHGLGFAAALAERFRARIQLLHVVEPPVLPEWGYAHIPRREAKLRRAAEERLPQLALESGIDAKLIESAVVLSGAAAEEICQAADERCSNLVVIASHGLGGLHSAVFGSTAERVVRRAPCPVLTVRDRTLRKKGAEKPGFDLKRIVVTTDFSEASKKAFPYSVALARKFEASLLLLYVVPAHLPVELSYIGIVLEERRLMEEARERLPRFRQAEFDPHWRVDTLVLNGAPAQEICRTAEAERSDLIVMATHGHTGLKHFLLGSVTENVVRHAPCPVLVVREREREFLRG